MFRGGQGGLRAGGEIAGVRGGVPMSAGDYDGDGDDEFVIVHSKVTSKRNDSEITVTDGRSALNRFRMLCSAGGHEPGPGSAGARAVRA